MGFTQLLSEDHKHTIHGHDFLEGMVTGDETWVYLHSLETKQANMEWKRTGSPRSKNFKMGNLRVNCFWDHDGVLLVNFMEKCTNINAASYSATLQRLRAVIKQQDP
jgi:hypothetical protein